MGEERILEELRNQGGTSVALIYPNTYFVGMSNLGFQAIHTLLGRTPGIICERAFLPDQAFLGYFREKGNLRTLESQKPIHEFEIVAFSVSYELDFVNVAQILQMSNIPLLSSERGDCHPLVICGGAITYLNPEPIADFVDCFVLGEGETVLPALLKGFKESRNEPRERLLKYLAGVPGIYVPSLHKPLREATVEPAAADSAGGRNPAPHPLCQEKVSHFFHSRILTNRTEFGDTLLAEIMRGCAYGCTFCAVGNSFGPLRLREPRDFSSMLESLPSGIGRIGLIGAAINCHPRISELLKDIRERKITITWSSMRIDRVTEEILDLMREQGQRTLTVAPECGSDSLRSRIRKYITNDEILKNLGQALTREVTNIRLYFMVGLPEEGEDDLDEIIRLINEIRSMAHRMSSSPCRISASVNQFIPKAGTPLEGVAFEELESVSAKMEKLRASLPPDIRLTCESPRWAFIQALLARGDRRLGDVLGYAGRLRSFADWKKALRTCGIDPSTYLRQRSGIMPWSHLKGVELV